MDAIKYLEERLRMCNSFFGDMVCNGCEFSGDKSCCMDSIEEAFPANAVSIVSNWSKVLLSNIPNHAYVIGDVSDDGWLDIMFDVDWLNEVVK